jgi:hypothetical protein
MTVQTTALYPTDMVLIQQITAVNASFVQFNLIPTTYNYYILFMTGVSSLNNGDQLALQMSPDNVSWIGGQQTYQTAASTPAFTSLGQNIAYYQLASVISGFATGYKANGQIYLPIPSIATGIDKLFNWEIACAYNVPQVNVFNGGADLPNNCNYLRLFGWNGVAVTGLYGFFSLYGIVGA